MIDWDSRSEVTAWATASIAKGITVDELVEAILESNNHGYNAAYNDARREEEEE